jgi:hypothetical protein
MNSRSSARFGVVLCACGGAALFAGMAPAAEEHSRADAEQYIKASEAAWAESVATNDDSVVRRILADDCVWVLDGAVWDKTRAVADAAKGPGDFLSDHLDEVHVRFFGDTAVVQGSETWTRRGNRKGRFVWTDTWVQRNGRWQIVQAEDITVWIRK